MVSKRVFKKFVPKRLKIPDAHFEISFTNKDLSKPRKRHLEQIAEDGNVVYDTKNEEFCLSYRGREYATKLKDEEKIPDYVLSRIKIELPENLFPQNSQFHNMLFCYFNPFSRSWIHPNGQSIPPEYGNRLYGYLSALFEKDITQFNKLMGRKLKRENVEELARQTANIIAHN